ncbi:MAG TPA: nucleotidyltransferase domain-containing protein [Methanomicrobiales archaeon]|nr:nucleotidyltransferase domain-containing protein [Methanomicrobiales archaeon]
MSPGARKIPGEARAVIDRAVSGIPKEGVTAIFLYGSVARGEEKPMSDIDICIVTERGISRSEKEQILVHASPTLDLTLFHDLPLPIRFRVLSEGMLIWGEEGLELHRIRRSTIRCYREIGRMIRRHERRVLDA